MLSVAILVFRETLEAAPIVGVVAAAARSVPQGRRALATGVGAGGAVLVALFAEAIAASAQGMGARSSSG